MEYDEIFELIIANGFWPFEDPAAEDAEGGFALLINRLFEHWGLCCYNAWRYQQDQLRKDRLKRKIEIKEKVAK